MVVVVVGYRPNPSAAVVGAEIAKVPSPMYVAATERPRRRQVEDERDICFPPRSLLFSGWVRKVNAKMFPWVVTEAKDLARS